MAEDFCWAAFEILPAETPFTMTAEVHETDSEGVSLRKLATSQQSFTVFEDGRRREQILLRDAIGELKGQIIGERLWSKYRCWPMYSL